MLDIKSGKKQYCFLLKGHPTVDYDVDPICFVILTPEDAKLILKRLNFLKKFPGVEDLFSCDVVDGTGEWFTDPEFKLEELTSQFDRHGVSIIPLDRKQTSLVKQVMEASDFRVPLSRMVLCPSRTAPKNTRVYWSCYEKHCEVEIMSSDIYVADLQKMAK